MKDTRDPQKINAFLASLKKERNRKTWKKEVPARSPITHELKCWPEPFHAKWMSKKNWEIRLNDRGFAVGDTLIEKEFAPMANNGAGAYGNSEIHEEVLWILDGGFGLLPGFIIMSTRQIKRVRIIDGKREEFTKPYTFYEQPPF